MPAKAWMEIGGGVLGQSSAALAPAAGSIAWYDPSVASSITSSGGAVSQINDLSGNGHHLVQATGVRKPTTGTRTINSLNVLDYTSNIIAVSFTQAIPVTVIGVVKSDATGAANNQWFGNAPDGSSTSPTILQSSGNWAYFDGTTQASATAVDTSAHCISVIFDASAGQMWLDGTSIKTGNPDTQTMVGVCLGGSGAFANGWDGVIAEVLVYASVLSTGNRQATEAYLKAKWGTP